MLGPAMGEIDFAKLDLLIIENVGNLVCPAEFALPVHYNVTVISTPEGSDRPVKYPLTFSESDVLVINKMDLLPHVDFDLPALKKVACKLKPGITFIETRSARSPKLDFRLKLECFKLEWLHAIARLRFIHSGFGLESDFGVRASSFVHCEPA
jgi:hydrogenase nickel incorporation protein HypB